MGQFGGVRAVAPIREFLAELGCPAVSNTIALPKAQFLIEEDGEIATKLNAVSKVENYVEKQARKSFAELLWMAQAMRNHRELVGIPDATEG
jgi:hypothetical protein